MINEDGAVGEIAVGTGKSKCSEKTSPEPFSRPKIPHNLTQAAAARSP
jgi:hypothetical protein